MGVRTTTLAPFKENTGAFVASYGFTYDDLRLIIEGLDELISYHEMWLEDERIAVIDWSRSQIEIIKELTHKVDYYKDMAYKNKLTGDDEE